MSDDSPTCPECGGVMRIRQNRQTHENFYGCAAFPECKGTLRIDADNTAQDELPSDRYRQNDRRRWRE